MKLKVVEVFLAYTALTGIIGRSAAMPLRAKFRIARMHEQLTPEFKVASGQRDALITAHGDPVEGGGFKIDPQSAGWAEYADAWGKVCEEEVEVAVQPVAFEIFGEEAGIEAKEFIALGQLVVE